MVIDCITSTQSVQHREDEAPLVFDSSVMRNQLHLPKEFIWPDEDKPSRNVPELDVPVIDLGGFFSGDPIATEEAARLIGEASQKHGFFLVVNHGVDAALISRAHSCMDDFFETPLPQKQRAQRKTGEPYGYASSSFTGRFLSNLPWKETLSFEFSAEKNSPPVVKDYLTNKLGKSSSNSEVYQEYCEAMSNLSLGIVELLGMSLGVGKAFRDFYEDNCSIMRLNYYPHCQKPDLTLGTGPHCDPTSLTILHQDQVGGLQIFADNQWCSVNSDFNAFVVDIGDTLTALTNGRCKSCLHRAEVNSNRTRKSLTFFLNSNDDKVVSPPSEFVDELNPRICPDFTWPVHLEFTQKHHRSDDNNLEVFVTWLRQNKGTEISST